MWPPFITPLSSRGFVPGGLRRQEDPMSLQKTACSLALAVLDLAAKDFDTEHPLADTIAIARTAAELFGSGVKHVLLRKEWAEKLRPAYLMTLKKERLAPIDLAIQAIWYARDDCPVDTMALDHACRAWLAVDRGLN